MADAKLIETCRALSLKNRRRIYRDEFQIPAPKRALYLLHYALAGLRKYRSRKPSGGG